MSESMRKPAPLRGRVDGSRYPWYNGIVQKPKYARNGFLPL